MDKSLKDSVLELVDIVEVIGERVALRKKGKDYVGLCPFHDDHTPSFSVSPTKKIYKCWSCGEAGDVFKFVQKIEHVEFREALTALARRVGLESRIGHPDPNAGKRDALRPVVEWARKHFVDNLTSTPAGREAYKYATGRGMSAETIERFQLGFAADSWDDLLKCATRMSISRDLLADAGLISVGDDGKVYDKFRNRLMFPILDATGRTVAFGGRALGDRGPKYLNSPETPLFNKSRLVYGFHQARPAIQTTKSVVVVEGYVDAVLVHQAGVENAVATLGTALTDAHAKLLLPLVETVYLCFDSDEAGRKAADRAVETALRHEVAVKVALMPDRMDPADCVIRLGAEAFSALLQTSVDALEFKWRGTVSSLGGSASRNRRAVIEQFLQFVARVSVSGGIDPLQQGLLVGRLSELVGLPAAAVYDLLANAKTAARREVPRDTPDTSESSAYAASLRGLPIGLVSAVEEFFGCALLDSRCLRHVDDGYAAAVERCDAWKALDEVFRRLSEERDEFDREAVLNQCDEPLLCELVARCSSLVKAESLSDEYVSAVRERLSGEMRVLRIDDLRGELRENTTDPSSREAAFRHLLDLARNRHDVLPSEAPRGSGAGRS